MKLKHIAVLVVAVFTPAYATAMPVVFSANADTPEELKPTVDAFRSALGDNNGNAPEIGDPNGHRSINWDAAPDFISDPNPFPGDFFNFNAAPRARGIEFTPTGDTTGFELSSTEASGEPVAFGLPNSFVPFSDERLFRPVNGTTFQVDFFDPANNEDPALTRGLGVVFNNVFRNTSTSMTFFNQEDEVIFQRSAEAGGFGSLSFLGAIFDDPIIAYAQFDVGDFALDLAAATINQNFVVMDDFIFGEPISANVAAVPIPGSVALLPLGLAALGGLRRRKTS